jgi:hypothetical protein
MTIGEIASRFEVSPAEIHRCKKKLMEEGVCVFEGRKSDHAIDGDELQKLHASIGRLTIENDFLSRALGRLR